MIDALLKSLSGFDPQLPGICIGVFRDGAPLFQSGCGLADLRKRTAITTATNFRLASLSKQFTAMAIMILKEQGALGYSDPLRKYFQQFPDYADDITIRHLLNNQGGLKDYEDLISPSQSKQMLDRDILDLLAIQDSVLFSAGERYHYSNGGYILLGLIASCVSGLTFAEFVSQKIFLPLGMDKTVAYECGISTVENRAYGYTPRGDHFELSDQSITSATLGDGGIYSSIEDLSRWERELLRPTIVSMSTLKEAFTPSYGGYGFGWMISEYQNVPRIGHTGSTVGFRAAIQRYLKNSLTIIILSNRTDIVPWTIAEKIAFECGLNS